MRPATQATTAALLSLALFLGSALRADETPECRIIVNRQNSLSSLARERLAEIFLKKVKRWDDGREVASVDQSLVAPVRAAFSKSVLKRPVQSVQLYWRQQLFSGLGFPPPVRSSDEEVIQYVQENPGAIGYVSAEARLEDRVKVLRIVE